MIGQGGKEITYEDLKTVTTPLSREINKRLKAFGFKFTGYVIDGKLSASVSEIGNGSHYGESLFYIDGFLSDNKHAQIRYVPDLPESYSSWCNSVDEAKDLADNIKRQVALYEWLCEQDFSQLYHAYEKDAPMLQNGSFRIHGDDVEHTATKDVATYIRDYYGTENFIGHGYRSENRTIVIMKDIHNANHLDLHVFEDGKDPYTSKYALSSRCIDDFEILHDDGENIELSLECHCHSGHKCTDFYCSYGVLYPFPCFTDERRYKCDVSPFVFYDRQSESGGPPIRNFKDGRYEFVVADENLLTGCFPSYEEALEMSKNLGGYGERFKEEYDREL
jgi:hypothetical protein